MAPTTPDLARSLLGMRPLVLVPGRLSEEATGIRSRAVAAGRRYLEALDRAGATGAVVSPAGPFDDRLLDRFDGVLLLGGGDVDPAQYGQEAVPEVGGVVAEHDAFELAVAVAAAERGVPVLAICRGHQVLNVALGGTLVQHVDGHRKVHHEVQLENGCRLALAVGDTVVSGHSVHHQVIDRLGAGLRAVGTDDAGVIEAVELEGGAWVVGVQWHPEDTAADDPANQGIFDAFAAACRDAAAKRA